MYGHKQILSCLAIVILVSIFNFYRSAIKRDKEHRLWRAQKLLDQQLEQLALDQKRQLQLEKRQAERIAFEARWLEYDDHCCDLHALIFRPSELGSKAAERKNVTRMGKSVRQQRSDEVMITMERHSEKVARKEMPSCEFIKRPATPSVDHVQDKVAGDLSTKIIYIAVFVLLVSLGKAAFDWSKQFKELQQTKTLSEDEVLRRCSLQAYSLIKHKQGQQVAKATALEPFLKKTHGGATLRPQLSLDSGADQTHEQQREFVRRISTNPQDYRNGSGLTSEPGTPVKPGKLLDSGSSRRPSMDSFSEDDSTTTTPGEAKRRVRMIHRH